MATKKTKRKAKRSTEKCFYIEEVTIRPEGNAHIKDMIAQAIEFSKKYGDYFSEHGVLVSFSHNGTAVQVRADSDPEWVLDEVDRIRGLSTSDREGAVAGPYPQIVPVGV